MRFAEAGLGGDFERQRVRVDVVVAAVVQRGAEVHGGEVREHAVFLLHLQALFHRRHEFARHRAADRFVDELEARAALQRLELDPHFGELARTAGLLLVDVVLVDRSW